MLWDIVIAAGVGSTQLVLTWYGIHISVKEHRVRNAVIIGVVGLVGIVLTISGAVRAGIAQHDLQAQLDRIEHNPPRVEFNVPAAAPPQVIVAPASPTHIRPETSRGFMQLNAVQFVSPSLPEAGASISANVYLTNKGTEPVDDFKRQFMASIQTLADNPDETDRAVRKAFAKHIKEHMSDWRNQHVTVGVGDKPWNTLTIPIPNQVAADQIKSGKARYYINVWATWEGAKHDLNICEWLQPPGDSDWGKIPSGDLVWHLCAD